MVVAMEDAVLVASKDHAEAVKDIVEQLKGNGRAHALAAQPRVPAVGLVPDASTGATAIRSNASW